MPQPVALSDRYPGDLARVTVLRCFGIRASGSRNTWNPKHSLPFLAVILVPLVLALGHQALGHPTAQGRTGYYFWLSYYVVLDLFVVLAQWVGCRAFHQAASSIDRMLTRRGRDAVDGWIDRGLRPGRQERWMGVGAVGSCLTVWALSTVHEVSLHMYIDLASYLNASLAGAAGANSLFWLLRASRLSRIVTKWGCLRLAWPAPARTPGIEALSRWYRIVTLWSVAGAAVAFAPWVWLSPYVARSGAFLVTKWVLAGILLVAIVLFGFYSQWRLSQAVLEKRAAVLRMLARRLPRRIPGNRPLTEDEVQMAELFTSVSESPSGMIDGQTLAATLLSVAAALVPLAVAALVR